MLLKCIPTAKLFNNNNYPDKALQTKSFKSLDMEKPNLPRVHSLEPPKLLPKKYLT